MKKLMITTVLGLIFGIVTAQPWSVNPADYEFSMNIVGQAYTSGTIANHQDNYIGAFVDNVCVGVCQPIEVNEAYQSFYLTVYSNQSSGDMIHFKIINSEQDTLSFLNTIAFSADRMIGNTENPFLWMDEELYQATDILEFSFSEQLAPAEIDPENRTVHATFEEGTDVSHLSPEFKLAPGAVAKVGAVNQVSGISSNDYSSELIYTVTGADLSTSDWTISISFNTSVRELPKEDVISVYPNPAIDFIHVSAKCFERVEIINPKGQVVLRKACTNSNNQIDISGLDAGMYIVRFPDRTKASTKLIKK